MQVPASALEILGFRLASSSLENTGDPFQHGSFSLEDLDVVDVQLLTDLLNGFDALDGSERDARLELWIMSSAFCFHGW
jgi:hypothetical protein